MKGHQRVVGKNDEWLTPKWILEPLGQFDLDPCAPAVRPWDTATNHISLPDDGLTAEWKGRVWLNPPFNRYERPRWMARMSEHPRGTMLIPAATETDAFIRFVFKCAVAVCFLEGRPHFHYVDGKRAAFNCGTAIALAAYSAFDADKLAGAGYGRVLWL